MASLKIENVPDALMKQLKARAKRLHRPVEEEVKATLANAVLAPPRRRRPSVNKLLARAKAILEKQEGVWITIDFIEAAINEGRP